MLRCARVGQNPRVVVDRRTRRRRAALRHAGLSPLLHVAKAWAPGSCCWVIRRLQYLLTVKLCSPTSARRTRTHESGRRDEGGTCVELELEPVWRFYRYTLVFTDSEGAERNSTLCVSSRVTRVRCVGGKR